MPKKEKEKCNVIFSTSLPYIYILLVSFLDALHGIMISDNGYQIIISEFDSH